MIDRTKKYKVVGYNTPWSPPLPSVNEYDLKWAQELKDVYGLNLDVQVIALNWRTFSSDLYCAGWVADSKESIERCFGVVLEEIQ